MAQDCGLWFPTQSLSSLSSLALDPNLLSKTRGTMDMFSTQLSQSHFDGSHGLVHESYHSHSKQFLPPQSPCMKQMPLASLSRNRVHGVAEGECTQKRFLVFDQSGDKTTLLLTSDIRKSFESLKQPDTKEEIRRRNKDLVFCQGVPENGEPDSESENHEDTEELNALLYSEDGSDYYSEEDEVTSTVSAHVDQETFVVNNGQPQAKKRKVLESYDLVIPPFLETSNKNMLDAESRWSCGSCGSTGIGFRKRSKPSSNKIVEEEIFETVSLLRGIIPGEELLDPILVIERAIDYLKSLKTEAKNPRTRDSLFEGYLRI